MPKKTRIKKEWTNKEILYIKEYSGKYSNKYLAKKFGVNIQNIRSLQFKLNINVKDSLIKHDSIYLVEFADLLGLTYNQASLFIKNNLIIFKRIGIFISIPYSEYERIELFLSENIKLTHAKKLFNKNISTNELKTLGINKLGNTIYLNKKLVIDYKNKINESLSVIEFAKKTSYTKQAINYMINTGKIQFFLDNKKQIRIEKKEIFKIIQN